MKPLADIPPQPEKVPAVPPSEPADYALKNSDVKYQNLLSQLNPHFLFNSLATLESLIYSDQRLAVKFLSQLTRVYRYILTTRSTPLVTLQEELTFIKDYVDLLQTRFGKGLEVRIEVAQQHRDRRIVPAVVQILIENATRHNSTDPDFPLIVTIQAGETCLIVQNNLRKKNIPEPKRREALKSLCQLYAYFSAVPIEVQQTANLFQVVLPLL